MGFTLINSDAGTLQLPSPEFGNTEARDFNVSFNRNRASDPYITVPAGRPSNEILTWSFTLNTKCGISKNSLDTWLQLASGELTTVVDHEGRSFGGIIVDPTINSIEGSPGLWDFSLTFLGEELILRTLLLEDVALSLSLEDGTCLLLESSI
jgi:hypothetical protein